MYVSYIIYTISFLSFFPMHAGAIRVRMHSQLTYLNTNDMLRTMFLNISTLANICLSKPVSTASVERSFSRMKLIKTRSRNRIRQSSFPYLMKMAIETPEKLSDFDLDAIISEWSRKPRRIVV